MSFPDGLHDIVHASVVWDIESEILDTLRLDQGGAYAEGVTSLSAAEAWCAAAADVIPGACRALVKLAELTARRHGCAMHPASLISACAELAQACAPLQRVLLQAFPGMGAGCSGGTLSVAELQAAVSSMQQQQQQQAGSLQSHAAELAAYVLRCTISIIEWCFDLRTVDAGLVELLPHALTCLQYFVANDIWAATHPLAGHRLHLLTTALMIYTTEKGAISAACAAAAHGLAVQLIVSSLSVKTLRAKVRAGCTRGLGDRIDSQSGLCDSGAV
jgi:hypothetical protein